MVEEVSAGDRVFEVEIGRVAFAAEVDRAVDPALGTDRVRPLNRNEAEKLHLVPRLRQFHGGHEAGKASTHDDDGSLRCHVSS